MPSYISLERSFYRPLIKEFYENNEIIRLAIVLSVLPALSSCWYLVAGGAGAYGGYKMKEKGYTLQNPIAKEKKSR
jgi:hypothetical protein